MKKKCQRCKTSALTGRQRKFCVACAKIVERERQREYHRAWQRKNRPRPAWVTRAKRDAGGTLIYERKCMGCGKLFAGAAAKMQRELCYGCADERKRLAQKVAEQDARRRSSVGKKPVQQELLERKVEAPPGGCDKCKYVKACREILWQRVALLCEAPDVFDVGRQANGVMYVGA